MRGRQAGANEARARRALGTPGRAGWAVDYALSALSLFLTQFQLSTVPESILGGNFFFRKKNKIFKKEFFVDKNILNA